MAEARDARSFEFGGFRLDAAQRRLVGPDGVPVDLPSRAFDLLLFMVERPGALLDKSTLLKAVWPTTVVEESNLTQSIFALRRALGEQSGEPKFIATIPGRGYQFVASVTLATPAPVRDEAVAPDVQGRRMWATAAVLGIVLSCGAVLLWMRLGPQRANEALVPAEERVAMRTIAVMPFSDLSPDRDALQGRRAEWRRIVPKSSMRVAVPIAPTGAGS